MRVRAPPSPASQVRVPPRCSVSVCDAVRPDAKPSVIRISMEPICGARPRARRVRDEQSRLLPLDRLAGVPAHRRAGAPLRTSLRAPPHTVQHLLTSPPPRRPAQGHLGTVDRVKLNREIAAVLSEGASTSTRSNSRDSSRGCSRPTASRGTSCVALTAEFLVYATARGTLTYYYLQDGAIVWSTATRRRSTIFTNELGTRLVLVDDAASAYLFNPVNDSALPILVLAVGDGVLWDAADGRVFVVADARTLSVYVRAPLIAASQAPPPPASPPRSSTAARRRCSCTTGCSRPSRRTGRSRRRRSRLTPRSPPSPRAAPARRRRSPPRSRSASPSSAGSARGRLR